MILQVSPKQLARAIQVSESSVKRWCDQGVIATVRTAGGHRRIAMPDVLQFLRDHRHQVLRPEVLGLPATSGTAPRILERAGRPLRDALLAGDEELARSVIFDLFMADHDLTVILDQVMVPVLHEIGRLWSCGDTQVYQERRACEICLRILHELRQVTRVVDSSLPLAMGGTPEGDPYHLPNAMVDLTLRRAGWQTHDLGVGLPFTTLREAVQHHRPRLFWLSVSHIEDEEAFLESYRELAASVPPEVAITVGGQALTETVRRRMTYASYCDNLRHLETFARSLLPPGSPTTAPAAEN